jgi:alpha(1,3/1,4) fucosyltransferase
VFADFAVRVDSAFRNDELFNLASSLNANHSLTMWALLRRRLVDVGKKCHTSDVFERRAEIPDITLFLDLPPDLIEQSVARAPSVRRWALLSESEVVLPANWVLERHQMFEKIFTWSDPLVDNKRYFKLNTPALFARRPLFPEREKTGFCTVIAGDKASQHPKELYSERRRAIRWFERNHPGDLDLYGYGWDRPGFHRSRVLNAANYRLNRFATYRRISVVRYPSYRGSISDKFEVLSRYKFSICYENAYNIDGYITEKIFDCFLAGTVPIYLGAGNITAHVPASCFIDKRDFRSYEELYEHLAGLPHATYRDYLRAAANFIASEQALPFTPEHVAGSLLDAM